MTRRLVPALICLVVLAVSAVGARAQGATSSPPSLTIQGLTSGTAAARDTVTFRLVPQTPPADPKAAGTCTDWVPALERQEWQLYVQGAAAPNTKDHVKFACDGPTTVLATAPLLFDQLPPNTLGGFGKTVDSLWGAFDSRAALVDVGPPTAGIGPTQALDLMATASWQRWVAVGTILVGSVGFVLLVFGTNIARGPMPPKDVVGTVPCPSGCRPAFSLSRMQFLWWLFIVTMCFVVIVTLTGNTNTISTDTLVLLGIVGGTSLLAVTQDQRKATDENLKRADLAANYEQLAAPAPTDVAVPVRPAAAAAQRLTELAHDVHNSSRSFFDDLLSDANGLSAHRLQLLIWTVVLGVVFVVKTMHSLGMPDLDPNLLVLMGISNGTYFGFKINETQVPPAQTAQPVQ